MRSLLFFVVDYQKPYILEMRNGGKVMETEINSLTGIVMNTAKTGTETIIVIIAAIFVALAVRMAIKSAKETKTKDAEFKKLNADKYKKHEEYGFKCDVR